jgi:YggT family protein
MWSIVSLIFGLIELSIGLRFLFLLLGASAQSSLVAWIYSVTQPLVTPFTAIFGHSTAAAPGTLAGSVFEPASLIALIVYGIIGGFILRMLVTPHHTAGL